MLETQWQLWLFSLQKTTLCICNPFITQIYMKDTEVRGKQTKNTVLFVIPPKLIVTATRMPLEKMPLFFLSLLGKPFFRFFNPKAQLWEICKSLVKVLNQLIALTRKNCRIFAKSDNSLPPTKKTENLFALLLIQQLLLFKYQKIKMSQRKSFRCCFFIITHHN